MLINLQTLAILAIWATTTKATSAVTISTTVPVSTTAPLSDCSSICKLMESKIAPNPDPNSTLFTSLCKATGRDDCEAIQTRFSIDLAPASGDKLSFKCICKRNDSAGVEGTSTEESTTTSTTTITSTVWTTSPSVYATSLGTTTTPVGETSVGSSTTVGIATSTSVSGTKTTLGTSVVSSTTAPTAVLNSSFVNAAPLGSGVVSKSKPKAGTIAGIVIGVLVMLAVIGVGAVLIRRRRMQNEENKEFTNSIIEPEGSRYSSYRQSRNMF